MRLLCSVLLLAACGTDVDSSCKSTITYQTVGSPFLSDWCTGCHSSQIPPSMRQDAPLYVDLDTLPDLHSWSPQVADDLGANTMPPEGGPSDSERQLMMSWLTCGAP